VVNVLGYGLYALVRGGEWEEKGGWGQGDGRWETGGGEGEDDGRCRLQFTEVDGEVANTRNN